MRPRYLSDEIQELSLDGVEEQEEATVEDKKRSEESLEIVNEEDTFFDAQQHIKDTDLWWVVLIPIAF